MRLHRFVLAGIFGLFVLTDCQKPTPKPVLLGDTPETKKLLGHWSGGYFGVGVDFDFTPNSVTETGTSINNVPISVRKLNIRGVHDHTIDVHWTQEYARDERTKTAGWREPDGVIDYSIDYQFDGDSLKLHMSTMDLKEVLVLTRD